MADSDKKVTYTVGADSSEFESGMQRAADAARSAGDAIGANFDKLGQVFSKVQGGLIAITAVLAGGKMFKEATSDAAAYDSEVSKLAKSMGMTLDQASRMDVTLRAMGKTSDDLTSASMKLLKQVNSNESGLNALGLKTRDSNGHLLSMQQLLMGGLDVLRSYKEGVDRDAIAQQMFGKGAADAMGMLKLTHEELERGSQLADKYGMVLSGDNVAAAKKFKESQEELKIAGEALSIQIGNVMIPILTRLAQFMLSDIPAAFRGAKNAFEEFSDSVITKAEPMRQALLNMVAGIEEKLNAIRPQWVIDMHAEQDKMQDQTWNARQSEGKENAREQSRFKSQHEQSLLGPEGKHAAAAGGGDQSQMSKWEAVLAEQKVAFQEMQNAQGSFQQYSKQQELSYWQDKLAMTTTGTADNLAVRKRVAELQLQITQDAFKAEVASLDAQAAAYKNNMDARIEILNQEAAIVAQRYGEESKEYEAVQKRIVEAKRQAAEQLKQIDLMRADSARNTALAEVQAAQQQATLERDLGIITTGQLIQAEQAFEQRRFQIAMEGLRERLQILQADPDRSPVELARIQAEIEQLEQQHQLRMGQIRGQAAREQNKYAIGFYSSMQSGFAAVLQKTLQGTQTLKQTFQGLFQVLIEAITQMLAQMAAEWLVMQLKNMIVGKTTAESTIAGYAGEAGAAGTASMAAAPWPLNMTAPLFGAAMAAAAGAYATVASASGGYDIPSTVNPLVQAHASEMVLPAKHADVIRRMADEGEGGSGKQASQTIEFKATAMRGGFFVAHQDDLVAALKSANRKFKLA